MSIKRYEETEAFVGWFKDERSFEGATATWLATGNMYSGVDPDDNRVKEIVRRCQLKSGYSDEKAKRRNMVGN